MERCGACTFGAGIPQAMMLPSSLFVLLNHHPIACKAILDTMVAPCFVRDAQGHWLALNPAAEQAFGATLEQLQNDPAHALAAVCRQAEHQAFTQGRPCTQWAALPPVDAPVPVQLQCHPVFDAHGKPAFSIGQVLQASASAHADAPLFRTLVEWSPDAVLLLRQGRVAYASPAAVVLFGGEHEDALDGCTLESLLHPDHRNEQAQRWRAAEQAQQTTLRNETRCLHRDGHALDVDIQTVWIPLHGPDAQLVVLREISDRIAARDQRRQDEQALRDAALHTQTILDNMVDGVITINTHGLIETFNFAASRIFGYGAHEVLGRNVSMLMPEPHRSQHDGYLQRHLHTGEERLINRPRSVQGQRKDGSLFPMTLSVSRVERGGQATFVGLLRDDTEQKAYEEEIRRLAFYDPLTHLPNRRLLLDRLQHALALVERSRNFGALMFLDLDHFKQLNDTMGHDLGDTLLQQVAQRLQACVREIDSVARFGGDEFVVLLEGLGANGIDAATHAETVADKILAALGQPYQLRDYSHVSTPSLGIVVFGPGDNSVDDLLKKADVAMYEAKGAGRNTARFFDPRMQASVSAHAALEKELRKSLEQGAFLLHYQVQVDGDSRITGAEALVRWSTDPVKSEWVVAVNVSAVQFAQANFVAQVRKALAKTGALAQRLKIEITESMLMSNVEEIIEKMGAIKSSGVRMSLDDFGTGYSSLSYLKRLPLDQLKIDQSFVRDLLTDPNDAVIAKTVVALGHSLGLKVIAEGVETAQQRDLLLGMGCDAFQGYHFGRPVPAEQL